MSTMMQQRLSAPQNVLCSVIIVSCFQDWFNRSDHTEPVCAYLAFRRNYSFISFDTVPMHEDSDLGINLKIASEIECC